jgi:hypothetical protein
MLATQRAGTRIEARLNAHLHNLVTHTQRLVMVTAGSLASCVLAFARASVADRAAGVPGSRRRRDIDGLEAATTTDESTTRTQPWINGRQRVESSPGSTALWGASGRHRRGCESALDILAMLSPPLRTHGMNTEAVSSSKCWQTYRLASEPSSFD